MDQVDKVSNRPVEDETGQAVEREILRRKRLLRFYLLLLAIPVALGIIVLVFGRSDRRMVKEEIQTQAPTIVQREVGEQIKPTIKSEVQSEVQSAVQAQVGPALGQLDDLKTRQARVEEVAGSLSASQQETTTALRRENEALKSEVKNELRTLDSGVNQKLSKLDAVNEKLNRLDAINDRLNKLDAINDRLIKLERQGIGDRLNKLENRVETLTVRPGINGFPQKDTQPRVMKTPG
jgi:flagellar motility protein MotE (MotC chaperone)